MREFLKGLELGKETIDTIMAEYGKNVTEDKEKINDLIEQIKTYEAKIVELEEMSKDSEKIQGELTTLKKQLEEEDLKKQQEEENRQLEERIEKAFGDKEFANEFTKKAIMEEMKVLVNDKANKGKSDVELFENLVKDKEGVFANPNAPQNIDGVNENLDLGNQEKKEIPLIF